MISYNEDIMEKYRLRIVRVAITNVFHSILSNIYETKMDVIRVRYVR